MSLFQIELPNGRIEDVMVIEGRRGFRAEGAGIEIDGRDEWEALKRLCEEVGGYVI